MMQKPPLHECQIRVLVIDNDTEDIHFLRSVLCEDKSSLFRLDFADNLDHGIERLRANDIDIILIDLALPHAGGLEGFDNLYAQVPQIPVIVLTSLDDETIALEAVRRGAQDYLLKDELERTFLTRSIRYAIERHRVKRELDLVTHELRIANERLVKLTFLDPLTGLLNRRGLENAIAREIQWTRRDGSDLLVLLVDLDDFKRINDALGHAVGDVVLKEIARKLKSALRSTDYIARIGGDEFMILLPQTRPAEGMRVAERVRLAVSGAPVSLSSGTVKVTASLGVVAISQVAPTIDDLLVQTHHVLYKSKQAGKNRVSYESHEKEAAHAQEYLLSNIFEDLRQGQVFRAVKHPIYQLCDETKIGYELLSRSSVQVFMMPDDFFRVCLEAKMLTVVDRHCLKTCVDASIGMLPGERRHINLFPSTLADIPVAELLAVFPEDVRPGTYCLEISEQQIIGDPSYLVKPIEAFKRSGIGIAIDDVGFGRSCLESLILLEPNVIKIDKKCVAGVSEDRSRARSLKRLLRLAEALNTEVMAEGIETREDLEVLKGLGVKYGQGFLWGEPEPVSQIC